MSTPQHFDIVEIDLAGDGQNRAQIRNQALAPGRNLQQVTVNALPPGVEVSLHFSGNGRPFQVAKQGDTFELYDELEQDAGIFWSAPTPYPNYVLELGVVFRIGGG
jgi:hypothetical protein